MNFLSALPGFDAETMFRREKGTGNWNRALNDLRYGNARWRYFSLLQPPNNDEMTNSLSNTQARVTYEEVQEGIQNLVDYIENGSFIHSNNTESLKDYLLQILQFQKKQSITKEDILFQEVQSQHDNQYNLFLDQPYSILVSNSESLAENQELNRRNIAVRDSIDYWTRAFYNQLEGFSYKPISQKDAFAMIIASNDFYKHLTKDFDRQMSIFSRHGALKSTGTKADNKRAIELTSEIDFYALKNLYLAYDKYLEENNFLEEDSATDLEIKKELRLAMNNVMSNYFQPTKTGKPNFNKAIIKDKLQLATSVSKTIRTNLEKTLRKLSDKMTAEAKAKNEDSPKLNFSIKLGDDNNPWFYVSSEYGPVNMVYDMFNQGTNKKTKGQELVKIVIEILKKCIENFSVKEKLDLMGVVVPLNEIEINVEGTNANGIDAIKEGAINFINSGEIYKILNKSYQREDYWKSFSITNSNAFLSGFLGELSANFLTKNIAKARMTGDVYAILGRSTEQKALQSVNDLSISFTLQQNGKNKKYNRGINIKHYIYRENTLNLYEDQANFSVYNKALADKYLGAEDTQLLRFIVENEGYFKGSEEQIHDLEVKIVASHFSEFLRIHDYDRYSRYNLFFMINNVVYPTSYIYSCAIAQLEQISDPQKINELFAPNVISDGVKNSKETYENLQQARENWTERDHELRNFNKSNLIGHDLLIQGKGLRVNLVSTTLFGNNL